MIKLFGPSLLMFWPFDAAPTEEVDLLLSASAVMLRMMLGDVRVELPHTQMFMEKLISQLCTPDPPWCRPARMRILAQALRLSIIIVGFKVHTACVKPGCLLTQNI